MEHHQVDLYCYLQDNTRCKVVLLKYMDSVVSKWEEISRFVTRRWLSPEQCCSKEIKMYKNLASMFKAELMTSTIKFVNKKTMLKLSLHVLSAVKNITATLRPKCVSQITDRYSISPRTIQPIHAMQ